MASIDKRIVSMQFDNKQFESGIKATIESLGRLNKSLDIKEVSKGITGSTGAMTELADNVETVASRFSNLGIIGRTVLEEVTKSAINAGKSIYNSTLGQIISGGKRRALNLEHANFMFEGMGLDPKGVETINTNAMDAVMGTAYAFDDAAVAASQLYASQVEIGEPMYKALRGIAGVAAMTNSEYSDMSRIFATVSGNGRLMGMQLTQLGQRGMNAAAVLGKSFNKTEAEVREMVRNGEVSFEMFAEAMYDAYGEHAAKADETFTGALANMKSALSRLGGDFWIPLIAAGQKVLLPIRRMIDGVRHQFQQLGLVDFVDENGEKIDGWFTKVVNKGADALDRFFDSMDFRKFDSDDDGDIMKINGLLFWLNRLTDMVLHTIRILKNLGSAFMTIVSPIKKLGKPLADLFYYFDELVLIVLDKMGEATQNVGAFGKVINFLREVVELFVGYAITGIRKLEDFVVYLIRSLSGFKESAEDTAEGAETLSKPVQKLSDIFEGFFNVLKTAKDAVMPVIMGAFEYLKSGVNWLIQGFQDLTGNLDESNILSVITGIFGAVALGKISKGTGVFKGMFQDLRESLGSAMKGITQALESLGGVLSTWQNSINAGTILKIAAAMGILAWALSTMTKIDSYALGTAVATLGSMSFELKKMVKELSVLTDGTNARAISKISTALIKMGIAILILTVAVEKLSRLNSTELLKGGAALGALMTMLALVSKVLGSNERAMAKGATGLILFSAAIVVLTRAVRKLSEIDTDKLIKGILALGAVMLELAIFSKLLSKSSAGIGKGAGALLIATSMVVISRAISNIGNIDNDKLKQGVLYMGIALAELAIFMRVAGKSKKTLSVATGMIALSTALLILAGAIKTFGQIKPGQLTQGLIGMAAALTIVAVAMKAMKGSLLSSMSLTVLTTAIAALFAVIVLIGKQDTGTIVKGILALAGALGVIAGTAFVLAPLTPVLLSLAAAVGIIGVSLAIGTAAIVTLATALTGLGLVNMAAIGTAFTLLARAIMGALKEIIISAVEIIPHIIVLVVEGITGIATSVVEAAPAVFNAIKELILGALSTIVEMLPDLLDNISEVIITILAKLRDLIPEVILVVSELIVAFLTAVSESLPDIVGAIVDIIITIVNTLAENTGKIIDAAFKLIIAFIDGLAEAIRGNGQDLKDAIWNLISAIIEAVVGFLGDIWDAGKRVVGEFIKGLFGMKDDVEDAGEEIGGAVPTWISYGIGNLASLGRRVITALGQGIGGMAKGVWDKATSLGSNIKSKLSGGIGNLGTVGKTAFTKLKSAVTGAGPGLRSAASTIGSTMMNSLKGGISSVASSVAETAKSVASGALSGVKKFLGIASPSKVLFEVGEFFSGGFAGGIHSGEKDAEKASKGLGLSALDSMSDVMSMIQDVLDDLDPNPTLTPILDLDELTDAMDDIDDMFDDPNMGINATGQLAASAIAGASRRSVNGENAGGDGETNYIFNQTNNSPKALTRLEIYRQTQNQFAMLKGVTGE